MKKRIVHGVSLGLFLGVFVIGIGKTEAYFSDYDKAENQVAVGRNVTEIVEDFPEPTPTPTDTGKKYKKIVQISNESEEAASSVDCFVRVLVTFSDYDIGQAVTLLELDTENWVYDESDGYYYYKNILKKGNCTTPLFKGFYIENEKLDLQYQKEKKNFYINIYEESIQAGTFEDYRKAWNYYLNPIAGS